MWFVGRIDFNRIGEVFDDVEEKKIIFLLLWKLENSDITFAQRDVILSALENVCLSNKPYDWDVIILCNKFMQHIDYIIKPDTDNKDVFEDKANKIFAYWNTKKIVVHKKFTATILNAVKSLEKDMDIDEIYTAIDNYADIYHSDKTYRQYKRTLWEFLSRKNWARVFVYKNLSDYLSTDPIKDAKSAGQSQWVEEESYAKYNKTKRRWY